MCWCPECLIFYTCLVCPIAQANGWLDEAAFFCPQLIVYVNMTLFFHYPHHNNLTIPGDSCPGKEQIIHYRNFPKDPSTLKGSVSEHFTPATWPRSFLRSGAAVSCLKPSNGPAFESPSFEIKQ